MQKSLAAFVTLCAIASSVDAMHIDKTPLTATALVSSSPLAFQAGNDLTKRVYLMNIKLSPTELKNVTQYHPIGISSATVATLDLPSKVLQSMNNVPVLDQGRHGTCVTFATTAALDALLKKGDYISQLCSLELGGTLEKESYYPSGWDGSYGEIVINQMLEFGIVNSTKQKRGVCGGVTNYPTQDEQSEGTPVSLESYSQLSENINEQIFHVPLFNSVQRNVARFANTEEAFMNGMVKDIKTILASKKIDSRVTFGTLIPVQYCHAGACGKANKTDDSWVLTDEIDQDSSPQLGGHEMVIIGYDDNAVATDSAGKTHKGLFTLRNSWGNQAGDNGNYYMSYDFFKKFAIEANQLLKG